MPMSEEGRAKISAAVKARHRRIKREKAMRAADEREGGTEFEAAAKILEVLQPLTDIQRTQVIKAAAVLSGLEF